MAIAQPIQIRFERFTGETGIAPAKPPQLVTATWTCYKKAGGLLVSTEHRGNADGKPLHLWITNVAVKVTGSDKWVAAQ